MLSKTLAEKAAWKFSEENGIDIVTINPGMVIGPLLQPIINTSVEPILNLIGGTLQSTGLKTFPNTCRWVDVRDVANAHILAFENPSACGRYCVAGKPAYSYEVLKILQKLYPALKLPEKCADAKQSMPAYQVSQERAQSLGVNFTPLEVSLKDNVESLKEKNFL